MSSFVKEWRFKEEIYGKDSKWSSCSGTFGETITFVFSRGLLKKQ